VPVVLDPRDLYGLPLERFIAERDALAKELRAAGQRDDAARVTAMRKPSLAAWAVNQLVRTQRRAVAALFDAGDALARAQSELLAGRGDPVSLREAGKRERASVAKLLEAARGLLSSEGHELSPAMLERVSDTLHAAALDEHARGEVEHGCLQRELRHVGLGADRAVSGRPSRRSGPGKPRPPRKAAASDTQRRSAQAERERSERLTATRRAAAEARRAEAEARRVAERAQRALESAQQRRDDAAHSLAKAEAALADARARAEEAALTHERARRALEKL
jgi:hypothetical protein